MPAQIKRIAQTYLRDPVEVAIKTTTTTAANIRQRYWSVSGVHKLDAITRILEAEPFDAMIVFARTKLGTEELADKLSARGISAAAINGDMDQKARERTISQLKDGRIDVLVATDVAARGLDVERISHVLNFDIPYDTESYVHRIGRTGRAGRKGEAILFVTPRERGMLRAIERATRQPIEPMELPSIETVNEQRVSKFLGRITTALESSELAMFRDLVERYEREQNVPAVEIAAALAKLVQGDMPLLLQVTAQQLRPHREEAGSGKAPFGNKSGDSRFDKPRREFERPAGERRSSSKFDQNKFDQERPRPERAPSAHSTGGMASGHNEAEAFFDDEAPAAPRRPREDHRGPEAGMETFRIEVGHRHGVKPGNIVGAIANEAELESRYIGRIDIRDDFSLIDLPEGMPREIMEHLKRVRVAGQPLRISRPGEGDDRPHRHGDGDSRPPRGPRPGGPKPRGFKPRPR
jgi:ATP-dependent RNA helicase DeaD